MSCCFNMLFESLNELAFAIYQTNQYIVLNELFSYALIKPKYTVLVLKDVFLNLMHNVIKALKTKRIMIAVF